MSDKIRIEEVDSVAPPPKARVDDIEQPAAKLGRKKDYLDGFLAQKPAAVPAGEPGGDLHDAVIAALKDIYDPEIPVDIYELGLIYEVNIDEKAHVEIVMTLTSPNCPVAGSLPEDVRAKVAEVEGVSGAHVELVFEPTWDKSFMSEEAMLELGFL